MFPSFLCIGAQKAGTTWLYDNIKDHPEVWMAPVKEIFYFDGAKPSRRPLLFQLFESRHRDLRQHTFRAIRRRLTRARPQKGQTADAPLRPTGSPAVTSGPGLSKLQLARWHMRFMFLPRNDAWYASLFRPGQGQIAGDINPYLAHMDQARVAHVGSLMPNAKIIYLIRNPIDRLWSEFGMAMRDRNITDFEGLDHAYLESQLELASKTWLSTYLANLATWREVYPASQVMVGFFDQLKEEPRVLLKNVFDFIGIDSSDACIPPTVGQKSNASGGPRMTDRYRLLLSDLFMSDLEKLHAHFDNRYTARWLDDARQVVTA